MVITIFSDNKGQVSAELILVTVIFLVIALGFINLVSNEMGNTQTGKLGEARMLGEKIAETINTVYKNGPGYSINLDLPNADELNFTAKVTTVNSTGYLNMTYGTRSIQIKLIAKDYTLPINLNPGERYKVYNDNGTIRFTAF
ncbi:MAG: hypothetical protein HZC47_07645 [Methanobacterium sp.]|uniref:hypothetical protein n=1 Tax=Methanobacterium sp. TaxID=2164 RepID=UPI003D646E46|nr:hypothetical protein [Methanobacterium sp.]